MRLVISIALCLLFSCISSAAETGTLQERMSQSEFHAAGLDKLSPSELKALDNWLAGHQPTTTVVTKFVTPAGTPVFDTDQGTRQTIESNIEGKFSGWYGNTTFKLDNGQEWTQDESGQLSHGKYDHPKVKIKPMFLGSWLMYVEGCGCSVRVKRTK